METQYSQETEWTRRWERDYRSRWVETGGKFYPVPVPPVRTVAVRFAGVVIAEKAPRQMARAGAENDLANRPERAEPITP